MGRTLFLLLLLAVISTAAAGAGCSPTALMMLTEKDGGRIQPDCPLPAKGENKTVTVAILPSADPGVSGEFIGAEREVAVALGKKLVEGSAKASKPVRPIQVVELPKVEKYLAAHPEWRTLSGGTIAKQLGADYLIDMRVSRMSMYDPTFGTETFVGRAEVVVAVYDADEPDSALYNIPPHTSHQPARSGSGSSSQYRQWFVDRLATELSWRYVPHMPERELGPIK